MFRGEDSEPYKLEDFLVQWDSGMEQAEDIDEPNDQVKHHTLTVFEQIYAAKKELEA